MSDRRENSLLVSLKGLHQAVGRMRQGIEPGGQAVDALAVHRVHLHAAFGEDALERAAGLHVHRMREAVDQFGGRIGRSAGTAVLYRSARDAPGAIDAEPIVSPASVAEATSRKYLRVSVPLGHTSG